MDVLQLGPLCLLAGYLWAAVHVGGGDRRRRMWRAACFVAGVGALVVALSPPVLGRDDTDVPVHVVQHLLLMMVGPLLLSLGHPIELVARAAPGPWRRALRRARSRRMTGMLGGPPVWLAYFAAMVGSFWPPFYRLEATDPLVHGCAHLCLVLLGCCYWQAVAEPALTASRRRPEQRAGAVVAWLLAGMPVDMALGLALADSPGPLPGADLAGTHVGGQLFWMASMVLTGAALALVLWRWVAREERVAARVAGVAVVALSEPGAASSPAPGAAG